MDLHGIITYIVRPREISLSSGLYSKACVGKTRVHEAIVGKAVVDDAVIHETIVHEAVICDAGVHHADVTGVHHAGI